MLPRVCSVPGDDSDNAYLKVCLYFAFSWIYSMCSSLLKIAPAEYATNAFSSK